MDTLLSTIKLNIVWKSTKKVIANSVEKILDIIQVKIAKAIY